MIEKKRFTLTTATVMAWIITEGFVLSWGILLLMGYPINSSNIQHAYSLWIFLPMLIGAIAGTFWFLVWRAQFTTPRKFFLGFGGILVSSGAFSLIYTFRLGLLQSGVFALLMVVGLLTLVLAQFG